MNRVMKSIVWKAVEVIIIIIGAVALVKIAGWQLQRMVKNTSNPTGNLNNTAQSQSLHNKD